MVTLTLSFASDFFVFHICIASITLWYKFEYEFCPANHSKDGRKWLPPTSSSRRHHTLVISYPIASKFHIWITFIKLSPKFEYGLCQLTKMASKMATTYQFALVDTNKVSHLSPKFHTYLFYHTLAKLRIWILSDER